MEPQETEPKDPAQRAREAESEKELTSILADRIQRSREIIAELDGLVAASRQASAVADEQEARRRQRNPVRVVKRSK